MHESKRRLFGVDGTFVNSAWVPVATKQLSAACLVSLLATASAQAQAAPALNPAQPDVPPPSAAPTPMGEPRVASPDTAVAPPPVMVAPPPPAAYPVHATTAAPAPALPQPPVAPPAAVSTWTPVFTGSFMTRYELRQGYDNAGVARGRFVDGDAFFFRSRFGIGTGPIDVGNDLKVALQFTPQATGVFGAQPNTLTDAALGLHEGYLRTSGRFVRFDTGRFELNYGDALVLGNLDWNEVGRSFDGMRLRIASSPTSAWVDVFATVLREGRALAPQITRAGDGDQYFFGAYAALGPAITTGLDLDVYLFAQHWGETANKLAVGATPARFQRQAATQVTFGARAKQKIKIFDYRIEAGLQGGSRSVDPTSVAAMAMAPALSKAVDVLAYQADLELGVAVVPDKLRISIEGLYASGDKRSSADKSEAWDELFPTAHKWLGLTDAFVLGGQKRTNVASGVLHVTASPLKNLTAQADGHIFSRVNGVAGAAPAVGAPPREKGYAGAEVDIGVAYQLAKGLKARALYGVFMPDAALYPTASARGLDKGADPDPVHYAELELRYDL